MTTAGSGQNGDAASLSETVVSSVAAHKGVEEMALPSLYDVLDPDALDSLFDTPGPTQGGRVRFHYAGCIVVCESDGTVDVRDDGE
ncbi:HalOD1 output domain-containing protein [Halosimplex aquaticum]|uniref:HalOD1 output domain-containing protein n=1 Tax=Halosimplex aquaticum TaxID=3026162 RepID=A0ABD5Y4G0_9EURY|nr:HalOD1 output domain-containing protein [Halosimplex aquaticum]